MMNIVNLQYSSKTKKKVGDLGNNKQKNRIRKTSPNRLKLSVIKELKRVTLLG